MYGSEIDLLTGHCHELKEAVEFLNFERSDRGCWFFGIGAIAVLLLWVEI